MKQDLLEKMTDTATRMQRKKTPEHCPATLLTEAARELQRLRNIIDSRPAINAGLPQTYIEWSHNIYAADQLNQTHWRQ